MATSLLDIIAEEIRQGLTTDTEYNKRGVWVFRIMTKSFKGPAGFDGSAVFPLPMPPDKFNYTLPFSQEITVAQEGGVVAEEGGINVADITMSGSTGFKLRKQQTITFAPGGGFFTGALGTYGGIFMEVSGQMSFWILANRCFEGYSQLKQDPETAAETALELHIYKDQLHFEVIPITLTLNREASRDRVTYRYDIALKVVGEAQAIHFEPESEKSLFDEIADSISKIRSAIQSVSAAIDDITAAIDDLSRLVSSVTSIVDDLAGILDAATDLVTGAKDFFDFPRDLMASVTNLVDSAAELFEETLGLPADVYQTFLNVADDMDRLKVAARNHFKDSWSAAAEKYNKSTDPLKGVRDSINNSSLVLIQNQDDAAETAADSQGKMSITQVFGGAVKPGDAARRTFTDAQQRLRGRDYSGFEDRVVGQGDTIQSIAAKHLGDARKWLDLVLVNDLKPPYITASAKIPHTLQPGSTVTIPVSRPEKATQVLTGGQETDVGESQAVANLGTDFELVQQSNGQWGWAEDEAHGLTDARTVGGINNLAQGIQSRFRTTAGENIMFPDVGLPRLIGLNALVNTRAEAQLRARQQLIADTRIDRIVEFSFSLENDALNLNARVIPKGFSTARVISRTVT